MPLSVDAFQWTSISLQLIGVASTDAGTDGATVSAAFVAALATFE